MITTNPSSTWCMELHQALLESFNLEGFELLCSDLNITLKKLSGQTLADKVASLIEYMQQRQRLIELINACQQLQSRSSWDDIRHQLLNTTPIIPLSERFSMKIHPKVLPQAGYCEVIISNDGIRRTSYTITGSDPFGALNLAEGEERHKMVSPGYTAKVQLRVAPKKRPLIGLPQRHTFTVCVCTTPRNQQTIDGQIIIKPLLPTWVTNLVSRLMNLLPIGAR